jgi:NHL repeat
VDRVRLAVVCDGVAALGAGGIGGDQGIFSVAGVGTPGFSGDDGPANAAQLFHPADIAVMPDGGYLIADSVNYRVRRVSPAGVITTVAGTGTAGFSGDDGPASEGQLNSPEGVAVTADGGVLIADLANNRVRRVSPAGTITPSPGAASPDPRATTGRPPRRSSTPRGQWR